MIKGYVLNNSGKGSHIFKMGVSPGMKIPLETLYNLYKKVYNGAFDVNFLEWLQNNKIPNGKGFEIVIEDVSIDVGCPVCAESISNKEEEKILAPEEKSVKVLPSKMSARQIADLKVKDNPKIVLQEVRSIHKLRRAYSLCKGRPGKETLIKLIKERMDELN
jgi:hypothetical protein